MAKCLPTIYFFSTDFASAGGLVSQHIDVLGSYATELVDALAGARPIF